MRSFPFFFFIHSLNTHSPSTVGLATFQELNSHMLPVLLRLTLQCYIGEAEKKPRGFHIKWWTVVKRKINWGKGRGNVGVAI